MSRFKTALIAVAIGGLLGSGMAFAQPAEKPGPAPGTPVESAPADKPGPAPGAPAETKAKPPAKAEPKQAEQPPAKQTTSQKMKSAANTAKKWTTKQWNTTKKKFAEEKEKWAGCRKEAKEQKLTGRKSWSFLYDCMTKK